LLHLVGSSILLYLIYDARSNKIKSTTNVFLTAVHSSLHCSLYRTGMSHLQQKTISPSLIYTDDKFWIPGLQQNHTHTLYVSRMHAYIHKHIHAS